MAAIEHYNIFNIYHGEDGHDAPVCDFTEQSIRKGFVRKVYAILMSQLLVTMSIIALFLFYKPLTEFVFKKIYIIGIAAIVIIVCVVAMACCVQVFRTAPMNFIFLATYTIAQSFLLGVVTSLLNVSVVMIAVGITAAVCLGLTIFAFQRKLDFTMMGGVLVAIITVLLTFGILAFTLGDELYFKTSNLLYASAGALIFSIYLVYDTQVIMDGKHKYNTSPEEYIFAALTLYLDIIIIFIYILRILAGR